MSVDFRIRAINTAFYTSLFEDLDSGDYREAFFWRFQSAFGREPTREEEEAGWDDMINTDVVVTFREEALDE